jgi:hypothetical protein
MSKADRIKEEIGWLKVVLAVTAAVDASLVAWLAQDYDRARPVIVGAGFVLALVLAAYVVCVDLLTHRRLKELEDAFVAAFLAFPLPKRQERSGKGWMR